MKISIKYFSIIGIFLFIFILIKVDFDLMFSMIKRINPVFILLAFMIIIIELFMRAFKWNILINIFKRDYSFIDAMQTYLIGFSFGSVTPGKTGDIIKIFDLKKRTNLGLKQCISLSIFDRIIDFFLLLFLNLISVIFIIFIFPYFDLFLPVLVFLLVSFFCIIFFMNTHSKIILKPLFNLLVPKRFKKNIKDVFYSFRNVITTVKNKPVFIFYVLVNLLAWLVAFIILYIFALSLNLNVSILYFLLFAPIVAFVEVLPISIFGIGSRDITLILLFSMIGITKESMLIISWLILLVSIFPKVVSGFFLSWLKNIEIKMGDKHT